MILDDGGDLTSDGFHTKYPELCAENHTWYYQKKQLLVFIDLYDMNRRQRHIS